MLVQVENSQKNSARTINVPPQSKSWKKPPYFTVLNCTPVLASPKPLKRQKTGYPTVLTAMSYSDDVKRAYRTEDKRHALKHVLGRRGRRILYRDNGYFRVLGERHYPGFHKKLVLGTIHYLESQGEDMSEVRKTLEQLAQDSGWWTRNLMTVPTYEEKIIAPCKHGKLEEGGIYKATVVLPEKDHYRRFTHFVKLSASQRGFEANRRIHEQLHNVIDDIDKPLATDPANRLLTLPYHEGKSLLDMLHHHSGCSRQQLLGECIVKLVRHAYQGQQYQSAIPVLGELSRFGGGMKSQSFTDEFVMRYIQPLNPSLSTRQVQHLANTKWKELVDAFKERIGNDLDALPQVFSHGDCHPGNILCHDKPRFVDWESVMFAPLQFDLVKLLKRCGLEEHEERELVDLAFYQSRRYETAKLIKKEKAEIARWNQWTHYGDRKKRIAEHERRIEQLLQNIRTPDKPSRDAFWNAYKKMVVYERLCCAAKYRGRAATHPDEMTGAYLDGMSRFIYTDTLDMIRGTRLEDQLRFVGQQFELQNYDMAVMKVYGPETLDTIRRTLPDPFATLSIENLDPTTIINERDGPTKTERAWRWADRWLPRLLAATIIAVPLFTIGVHMHHQRHVTVVAEERNRRLSQLWSDAYTGIGLGEEYRKDMPPLVDMRTQESFAKQYDNVSVEELGCLQMAAYSLNVRQLEGDIGNQYDLREDQTIAAGIYLNEPTDATAAAALRLHRMKKLFDDRKDAYVAYITDEETARKWLERCSCQNYWCYSREKDFDPRVRRFVDNMEMNMDGWGCGF
ncbi:phosphotransferase [Candidatus Woesearchaeota archaeon]|nr:phosphotransferase [Candidatus Woesearchaeota archaeon]